MARVLPAMLLAASTVGLIASCGGSAFDGDGDGGAGASGSSSGGRGGSSSSGGSGALGGTAGKAGSGSGGGSVLPEACSLPAESGPCDAYFPSYFHNPATGVCEPFVYGGCDGNDNRFDGVEQCQAACHGGTPDLDACEQPSDCVLVHVGCCAPCDGGIESYAAINVDAQDAFYDGRECDVACEPCPAPDPTLANHTYQTATCRNGQCVPIDVRDEGAADCEVQEDCRLRDGIGCCEGCSSSETSLVAVNNSDQLSELVCDDEPVGCLACAPIYPPGYSTACESGRCALKRADGP